MMVNTQTVSMVVNMKYVGESLLGQHRLLKQMSTWIFDTRQYQVKLDIVLTANLRFKE